MNRNTEEGILFYSDNDPNDFEVYFLEEKIDASDFTLTLIAILKDTSHQSFSHACNVLTEFYEIQGMQDSTWYESITKYGRQYKLVDSILEAMKNAQNDNLTCLVESINIAFYCALIVTGHSKRNDKWFKMDLFPNNLVGISLGNTEINKIIKAESFLTELKNDRRINNQCLDFLDNLQKNINSYRMLKHDI